MSDCPDCVGELARLRERIAYLELELEVAQTDVVVYAGRSANAYRTYRRALTSPAPPGRLPPRRQPTPLRAALGLCTEVGMACHARITRSYPDGQTVTEVARLEGLLETEDIELDIEAEGD